MHWSEVMGKAGREERTGLTREHTRPKDLVESIVATIPELCARIRKQVCLLAAKWKRRL